MSRRDPAELGRRLVLTVPGEQRSVGLVRLFVGGLATRLGLRYENMDDLQLALESVLLAAELRPVVTVDARLGDDTMAILVGPLGRDPLVPYASKPDDLGLDRLLAPLVAGAESSVREDGFWLRLDVGIPAGSVTA
jgi:hypothetical protein